MSLRCCAAGQDEGGTLEEEQLFVVFAKPPLRSLTFAHSQTLLDVFTTLKSYSSYVGPRVLPQRKSPLPSLPPSCFSPSRSDAPSLALVCQTKPTAQIAVKRQVLTLRDRLRRNFQQSQIHNQCGPKLVSSHPSSCILYPVSCIR